MKKPKYSSFFLIMIILLIILSTWTVHVQAENLGLTNITEQKLIRESVQAYFDVRYRSHSTLQLDDFVSLVVDSPRESSFLRSEKDKLEIELHHAKLYGLRYIEYDYFLDFKEIILDSTTQSSVVSIIEGHDVEFEFSRKASKEEPIISSMRNLHHSIVLQKEDGL